MQADVQFEQYIKSELLNSVIHTSILKIWLICITEFNNSVINTYTDMVNMYN